jgi:hypothetical protein
LQLQHRPTTITFIFLKLSRVTIFPKTAYHTTNTTLK